MVAQPMTAIRTVRLVLLLLLASCSWASPIEPGIKAVETIRGKKFLREVRTVTIDRSDLSKYLTEQMTRSTPYSLDDWGRILRALQLIDVEPAEILPKLLALYESQVLAFYDPHSHTYYAIRQLPSLPDGAKRVVDPELLEETVMVHELTHALQDQHFALAGKEKAMMHDTDANLAYHAVLEGEAVLVMIAHMVGKAGMDFDLVIQDEGMTETLTSAVQADSMIDPATPRYFGELLKFPYLKGLEFVLAAYKRGGWAAIDRIHADPPRTTREVLHPEQYFARTGAKASIAKAPEFDATLPEGALAVEHLGEFHWRFLVGADTARGLANDRAVIYRDGRVEIETRWDSFVGAAAFSEAISTLLRKRGLEPRVVQEQSIVKASWTAE